MYIHDSGLEYITESFKSNLSTKAIYEMIFFLKFKFGVRRRVCKLNYSTEVHSMGTIGE